MKTILLIEDDQILRENTSELLEVLNYRVLTAPNGKLGIELAQMEIPDLILCDIVMPKVDGYMVYESLRKKRATRRIPFIFLSVKSDPEDIRRGMNLGADDYISKPFKEEDLISAIQSRLAKYAILNDKRKLQQTVDAVEEINDLDELRDYFYAKGDLVELSKHENLFAERQHASYLYLLGQGLIKTFRIDEYGKELITGIFKKGEFTGFYTFKKSALYPESASALEESTLYRISIDEFEDILFNNQQVTMEFAQLLSDNLTTLRSHLLEMAYGSVLKKTTTTILEFAEKIQENPEECIKISRSDLASVAGISTESFIRSLSCLKKEGLIDIEGRNIRILNLQKLHQIK